MRAGTSRPCTLFARGTYLLFLIASAAAVSTTFVLCLANEDVLPSVAASSNVTSNGTGSSNNGSALVSQVRVELHGAVPANVNRSKINDRKQYTGGGWGYGWGWGWGWGSEGGGGGGGSNGGGGGGGGSGPGGGGGGGGSNGGGGGGGGPGGGGGGGGGSGGCWWGCGRGRSGGGSDQGRRREHHGGRLHKPSYSSSLYRVGEYARCSGKGRCGGMKLLCPIHCEGPCFYDCDSNCRAHCRF